MIGECIGTGKEYNGRGERLEKQTIGVKVGEMDACALVFITVSIGHVCRPISLDGLVNCDWSREEPNVPFCFDMFIC